jgi:Sugar transport protein
MNPLSFVTFFTFGELGMMGTIAVSYTGLGPLWQQLSGARDVLFWLMLGGFVWVIGDLFQQYAAKYVGISRGIPLANTNQLWGLLWGVLVFGELHGRSASVYAQVVGGSLLMMLGVGAIAFSSATSQEQSRWKQAAQREGLRYGIAAGDVEARMEGRAAASDVQPARNVWDWLLVAVATGAFVFFGALARVPQMSLHWAPAAILSVASLALLVFCGLALFRTTRFQ